MLVTFIERYNFFLLILFMGCYFYQAVYVLIGLFKKDEEGPENPELKHYAVLISARNESAVIGELLQSIQQQDYPSGLIDTYVIADNCVDHTADIARSHGAHVFERFQSAKVGKGYALDYAFHKIAAEKGIRYYAGYLVFDADNVLDKNYIREMNRTFSLGYPVITSYRNSKNYDSNWISAGYALWFLRESRFLNGARMKCHTSCAISGTGFLVSSETIEKDHGWKYSLLTEDIEFSTDHIIRGDRIGYCSKAILYDEQPIDFKASWNQRMRWTKGFYQVFARYGGKLLNGIFRNRSFPCYDMLMTIAPATLITLTSLLLNGFFTVGGILTGHARVTEASLLAMGGCLTSIYLSLLAFGSVTIIAERKQIHCKTSRCLLYLFTFPIFLFTYIPISVAALFKNVTWKPVPHTIIRSTEQICRYSNKKQQV
ncbi:MAG: glycosyltransferase family 2 protein [Lachnospiraceae bacterium]|nr:glycosyltransferase family 2 protein [Lachnospiraceae bacterium]